jgi:hypothetical protein
VIWDSQGLSLRGATIVQIILLVGKGLIEQWQILTGVGILWMWIFVSLAASNFDHCPLFVNYGRRRRDYMSRIKLLNSRTVGWLKMNVKPLGRQAKKCLVGAGGM